MRLRLEPGGGGCRLSAELRTVPFERVAEEFLGEVKSATFHGLRIEREEGEYRATVVLDV